MLSQIPMRELEDKVGWSSSMGLRGKTTPENVVDDTESSIAKAAYAKLADPTLQPVFEPPTLLPPSAIAKRLIDNRPDFADNLEDTLIPEEDYKTCHDMLLDRHPGSKVQGASLQGLVKGDQPSRLGRVLDRLHEAKKGTPEDLCPTDPTKDIIEEVLNKRMPVDRAAAVVDERALGVVDEPPPSSVEMEPFFDVLVNTKDLGRLLVNWARALRAFARKKIRNPHKEEDFECIRPWAAATLVHIRRQIFCKLIQATEPAARSYIFQRENLRVRCHEEEGIFLLCPRATENAAFSPEVIFITPKSGLFIAMARTAHNQHHGRSSTKVERLLLRYYYMPRVGHLLEEMRSKCATCLVLDSNLRKSRYWRPYGPRSPAWAKREGAGVPLNYLCLDHAGPFMVRNQIGGQLYKVWAIIMVCPLTHFKTAYLTSNYGAKGVADVLTQHGSHHGHAAVWHFDLATGFTAFANAVDADRMRIVEERFKKDARTELVTKNDLEDIRNSLDGLDIEDE